MIFWIWSHHSLLLLARLERRNEEFMDLVTGKISEFPSGSSTQRNHDWLNCWSHGVIQTWLSVLPFQHSYFQGSGRGSLWQPRPLERSCSHWVETAPCSLIHSSWFSVEVGTMVMSVPWLQGLRKDPGLEGRISLCWERWVELPLVSSNNGYRGTLQSPSFSLEVEILQR